jgi:hypothetical protein
MNWPRQIERLLWNVLKAMLAYRLGSRLHRSWE